MTEHSQNEESRGRRDEDLTAESVANALEAWMRSQNVYEFFSEKKIERVAVDEFDQATLRAVLQVLREKVDEEESQ